ncbi:DUF6387 family protein [Dickeya parazeae]|uniref:DUF6387 family protein n=1 Tax=Dickeya parazeae TaxID=2893572 RepID=UPI001AECE722|nr:DUF6387 family protein [Dickeya parazeae]MBP2835700.1 hypothetical protein [Dickeya parazeae]
MDKAVINDFSWFDLRNYAFINNISVYDFINEIEWRHTLFYCAEGENVLNDASFEDSIKYIRIFRGDPHLEIDSEEEISFNNEMDNYLRSSVGNEVLSRESPSLAHGIGVMPVSFAELAMYNRVAIQKGVYFLDETGSFKALHPDYMLATVSKNTPKHMDTRLLLDLWLNEATDEEILSSIRKLLPKWRKEMSIPEPDILPRRRMGIKTVQKLIQNRILPMLDVLLWGLVHNKEISNPILSHIIYPDDPKDSQVIKETIRPSAYEAMSEPYTRLLRLYVDNDGEIGSAPVSDVMSRS